MKHKQEQTLEIDLNTESLGALLKQARIKKNVTQEQLGALLGINKSNISKIEKDASTIKIETFLKLMNALNTRVSLKVEL